jgi:hypothetical protein
MYPVPFLMQYDPASSMNEPIDALEQRGALEAGGAFAVPRVRVGTRAAARAVDHVGRAPAGELLVDGDHDPVGRIRRPQDVTEVLLRDPCLIGRLSVRARHSTLEVVDEAKARFALKRRSRC